MRRGWRNQARPARKPSGSGPTRRDPRAWLHGSRSFLLPRQLPKISEVETLIKVRSAEGKDRGQARTPVSPKVCRTCGPMRPCPRPRRLGRAPHASCYPPGHGQQSHITDNTQRTPARCTPTHSKTGSANAMLLPTWSGQET